MGQRQRSESGTISNNVRRVAVVGAGASGLAAAAALLEVGLTPVVYEEAGEVGGLWVYREAEGAGPAYRSLRTNTSQQITAFSDAPFPDDAPDFPPRAAVEQYLWDYAAGRDLLPCIRFRCSVRSVVPAGEGRWQITVTDGSVQGTELYDAVMVCSGIFRRPLMPDIPGRETFPGIMLHSKEYRVPERFAGQSVLVVGLGSSAVDIATDLVATAGHVTVSARRGAWIAPRTVDGRPLDHRGSRLSHLLPAAARARQRRRLLLGEYRRRGIEAPAAIWRRAKVPFDPEGAPSVTSDDLLPLISGGEIAARPAIERIEGPDVQFVDGSRLRPDTVIFATGYGLRFPFLPPALEPWSDAASGLYRLVFPPDHPTMAFIGVSRVHGPILPIAEMQARWAAEVLAGEAGLPDAETMRGEIAGRWRRQIARRDSPVRVALLPYLDEIAILAGVHPRLARHPGLLLPLLTGPPVAAQYRLDGPHRWAGAAAVIADSGHPGSRVGGQSPGDRGGSLTGRS